MTRTEESLRDAFLFAAESVEPGTLRPLAAPRRNARAARKWLVPLATGACVTAVAGGVVALNGEIPHLPRRGAPPPAAQPTGSPKFIVSVIDGPGPAKGSKLKDDSPNQTAEVRSATTGEVIAPVPAIRGGIEWSGVAAARDNRLFYLTGIVPHTDTPRVFNTVQVFRMRVDDQGRPGVPEPITRAAGESTDIPRTAVSPDGTRLALVVHGNATSGAMTSTLIVVDTETGARSTWALGESNPSALSWLPDDRHILFAGQEMNDQAGRLLVVDTHARGGDLLATARNIGSVPGGVNAAYDDGRFILIETSAGVDTYTWSILRMPASGGRPEAITSWRGAGDDNGPFAVAGSGHEILVMKNGQVTRLNDQRRWGATLQIRPGGGGGKSDPGVHVAW